MYAAIFNSVDLVQDINSGIHNDRKLVNDTLTTVWRGNKCHQWVIVTVERSFTDTFKGTLLN